MRPQTRDTDETRTVNDPAAKPADKNVEHEVAADEVVDEKGSVIHVAPRKKVESTDGTDPAVGATSPTNWWRTGLILLALLVAAVIVLQLMTGGSVTPTETPDSSPITDIPENDFPAGTPPTDAPQPDEPATEMPPD